MNLLKCGCSSPGKIFRFFLSSLVLMATLTQWAHAENVIGRIERTGTVQVCIWPEYFSITYRDPLTNTLSGMDIEMAEAFARELGVRARFVDSTFQTFASDLDTGRCDIAMFAIAIYPERKKQVLFSLPYLRSDIYVVVQRGSDVVRSWDDIDRPGVRVGVQAGTFLAKAMAGKYRHAEIVLIEPPQSRERELRSGRIDALLTNLTFSRRISNGSDWARIISPPKDYLISPYGYAVRHDEHEWLERVNNFINVARSTGQLKIFAKKNGIEAMLIP